MSEVMLAQVIKLKHEIKLITVFSPSQASQDANTELSREIDELLNKLTDKFSVISTELFAKSKEAIPNLLVPIWQ